MAKGCRILLIDGDVERLELSRRALASAGYQAHTTSALAEAIARLDEHRIELVIASFASSPSQVLDFVRHVRENFKETAIIVVSATPSVAAAVSAIKMGADHYLEKSAPAETLLNAVRETLRKIDHRKLVKVGSPPNGGSQWGLLGDSKAVKGLCRQIPRIARCEANVLIHGETGTGKELVARAIHRESSRSSAPFLSINCAELAAAVLESELFGHVRGAFTDARRDRKGMFRAVDGGTLFLDELGEMSMQLQAKLLRVLEDKVVRPVGTTREYSVDVRLVAATHRDLEQRVAEKRFREDLYFRVNVLDIETPPLRDRGNDLLLLAHHFLEEYTLPGQAPQLGDDAIQKMIAYPWPGNVRELSNLMQKLAVMFEGSKVGAAHLPEKMRFHLSPDPPRFDRTLAEVEEEHIRAVFAANASNQTRTAKILGIGRETLRRKLHVFGLIA